MLTGELRNKIDKLWDAFWTGGIANPLEVIEQITYLLFIRRLDDLQTLEENKATRHQQADGARRIFPEGKDSTRAIALRRIALVAASRTRRPARCSPSSPSTSSRSCARWAGTTPPTRST